MRENQYTTICNDPADALKLPEAPELERAVLGALLLEPQYVADVRGILTSTAFCNTQNAAIYDAICKLDDRGLTPDLFTVGQEAKKAGIPLSEVATLTQDVGSGVEILNHARILADLDMRRRLILWAEELKAKAQTDPDALNWAMSGIERIAGDVARIASARSIGDVMQDTLTALERRQQAHQRGECVGISTGLPCMDRITGGWRGGQLVILAARPAMGKTAVALHFAQAAAGAGVPVCIFSLEMPATQLGGRMLVGASGVDARAFRSGAVSTEDWRLSAFWEMAGKILFGLLYFDACYPGAVPGIATAGAVRYGRYRLFAADGPRFRQTQQPRAGSSRDEPGGQSAGKGTRRAGHFVVPAFPQG